MKLLLDTHVFLWYVTADARLPTVFRAAIQEPKNEVFLSVGFFWEVIIKHDLGRLHLPAPPHEYLPRQRELHGIASLPIEEGALTHLAQLPPLHRDPFDRILVAQSLQYELTLATVDNLLKAYPVRLLPG